MRNQSYLDILKLEVLFGHPNGDYQVESRNMWTWSLAEKLGLEIQLWVSSNQEYIEFRIMGHPNWVSMDQRDEERAQSAPVLSGLKEEE